MIYFIFNFFIVACLLIIFYFLYQGAVYVPSQRQSIEKMISLAKADRNSAMADLGSGDGRIVIAFARYGIKAEGFEINPLLVWFSRWKIKKLKLGKFARINRRSFWREDLSKYNIITVFGIDHIMNRLGEKMKNELKPGSKVLANIFPVPGWKYQKKIDGIYFYKFSDI